MADLANTQECGRTDLSMAGAILSSVVDEDFRRHCAVSGTGGGVLTIQVNDPGLVAGMRLLWADRILRAVQDIREFSSIRRVDFEYGAGGATVG